MWWWDVSLLAATWFLHMQMGLYSIFVIIAVFVCDDGVLVANDFYYLTTNGYISGRIRFILYTNVLRLLYSWLFFTYPNGFHFKYGQMEYPLKFQSSILAQKKNFLYKKYFHQTMFY